MTQQNLGKEKEDFGFEDKELSNIRIEVKRARLLILRKDNLNIKIQYEGKNIKQLDIDGFILEKNKIITVKNQQYNIQSITYHSGYNEKGELMEYGEGYYLFTQVLTKSFKYVMPVLGLNKFNHWRCNQEFCNCFVGIEGNEVYGDTIYLLYRFNGNKEFIDFERKLMDHPLYRGNINVDKYHILYKFDISEKYKPDVDKILQGKYSYVSEEYKERIRYFHNGDSEENMDIIEGVITRSNVRRVKLEENLALTKPIPKELDLLDIPDFTQEIYLDCYRIPEKKKCHSSFE